MDILEARIKKHEGFRQELYLDSLGNLTGGYGHFFYEGSRLPLEVCELLFKQDLANAINEFSKLPLEYRRNLGKVRRRVIVEMIFNMNLEKVLKFKKMLAAIKKGDFVTASKEMLDSKWAIQTKGRAIKLSLIMKNGEDL